MALAGQRIDALQGGLDLAGPPRHHNFQGCAIEPGIAGADRARIVKQDEGFGHG